MAAPWIKFLDDLNDEAGILAKEEMKDLVISSLGDASEFLKRQGVKMERYLNQLAAGEISKTEFEGYMKDIESLTRIQGAKLEVEARARAQRFADGIQNLILDGMLKLLP
jgi:hypothetical protein